LWVPGWHWEALILKDTDVVEHAVFGLIETVFDRVADPGEPVEIW
jgi:hypothetical protein